jgi:hypothetical protein
MEFLFSAEKPHWYDSKEGIKEMLKTPKGLISLIITRYEAARRGEKLNKFYILGLYCLDDDGKCLKAKGNNIPKEIFPGMPDVTSNTEFWYFMEFQEGSCDLTFVDLDETDIKKLKSP